MKTIVDVFGNRSWVLLKKATKKGLVYAGALVTCTVGLTFMSGFAQAYVSQDNIFVFNCQVGPRSGDIMIHACSTPGTSANPRNVQCQPRSVDRSPIIAWPD